MIHDIFLAPLTETYFQKALIGGSVVAMVSGVIGCLVILRRMAFLGDALSHAMIAGVAGGYLIMKLVFGLEAHGPGMLLGSLIAAVTTVALISFVSGISRIKEDTAIGIMYTGIFALGVVCVSIFRQYIHIDLMHFIMGDVLGVADSDLWVASLTAAAVLSVLILFYRSFQITTFDPVMAASIGLPVLFLDYLLTTCVSLVVVSGVSMVGVILVVGFLITPAATAYLLSDRLDRMMVLAAFFGVTSVIGGLYLCVWLDSAGGGAIILFCTLQFLTVLFLAPKYGLLVRWLNLRRMVPPQLVEDILTIILRHDKPAERSIIHHYTDNLKGVDKALKHMLCQGLLMLQDDNNTYALTETGQKKAEKILRAHRLWETYLASIGTPEEQLHYEAHQLEHVRAEGTVEYLDEKLGNPTTSIHGKKIVTVRRKTA
ncbi:MAG: metal ABC transporter permease [Desulfobulbus propionicus]|nr:MAG: metal ABC transporter permease [Desulfobulbus propionicus]